MAVTDYRGVTITSGSANDYLSEIVLSTDDEQGRILKFELWNGGTAVTSTTGLSARFYIDVNGNPMWQDMQPVSGTATATWSAALKMGGITAGKHRAEIRVTDSDGGIVATRPFVANVQRGVIDGADSEVMTNAEDLLAEVETINLSLASDGTLTLVGRDGTVTTSTAAKDATTSANTAASAANTAATAANTAADAANDAAARAETAAKPTEEMFASVHELLRAGSADAVTGSGDVVSATFLQRASNVEGARDGVATIECIRGNTVGWNQLLYDGDTLQNGVWGVADVTPSTFETRKVTITAGETTSNPPVLYMKNGAANLYLTYVSGHKYLYRTKFRGVAGKSICCAMGRNTMNDNRVFTHVSTGEDEVVSGIWTYTAGESSVPGFRIGMLSAETDTGDTIILYYLNLYDLTAMFGAGNEPSTVEEFEALYPLPYYAYDAGTLKHVNMTGIESTGFNLLDPARIAALDSVTQSGDTFTANIGAMRNAMVEGWEGIDYIPGASYEISYEVVSNSGSAVRFDITYTDGTTQSPSAMVGKRTHIVDASHTIKQIQLNYGSGGTIVFKDFCIHLVQDGTRNGEYEPHWSQLREIDLAKYFPDGMNGFGDRRDVLYSDHAYHVVGTVDMGSATWHQYDAANYPQVWYCDLPNRGGYSDVKTTANLMYQPNWTGLRENTATDIYFWRTDDISAANHTRFFVSSGSFISKTAVEMAAYFAHQFIFYCINPTVTPIDPPLNLSYRVDTYGTERIVTPADTISAPPTMDISYGYTAESLRDEALTVIAPVENHRAQTNHAVGSYVIHDATLYKVTRAIAANEEFTPGTNVTATTVMAEVAALNN